jgi:hypothetical protein
LVGANVHRVKVIRVEEEKNGIDSIVYEKKAAALYPVAPYFYDYRGDAE